MNEFCINILFCEKVIKIERYQNYVSQKKIILTQEKIIDTSLVITQRHQLYHITI